MKGEYALASLFYIDYDFSTLIWNSQLQSNLDEENEKIHPTVDTTALNWWHKEQGR